MKIVIKFSGKLVSPSRSGYIARAAGVIRSLFSQGHRIAVVVGGGEEARRYIEACRSLGGNEGQCDLVGIEASRLNALLMVIALGDIAHRRVVRSLEEFLSVWDLGRVVAAGGFQPGQSTSAVSALIAEAISADLLINATVVKGIYDKDPRKHPEAVLLREISPAGLRRLLEAQSLTAGGYELLDTLAVAILERSRVRAVVLDGRDPEILLKAVSGEEVGTLITP